MKKDLEILKALNTKLNRTRITIINDFPFILPTKKGEMWPQTGYVDVGSLQIDPMNKIYVIDPKGTIGIVDDINLDNEIRVKTLSSGFESAMADVMHSANIIVANRILDPTPAEQYYKFAEIEMPTEIGGGLAFTAQWDLPNLGTVTARINVHNRGFAPDNIITDYSGDARFELLNVTGEDNSHISVKTAVLFRYVEYPTPKEGIVGKCELYFQERASDFMSDESISGMPEGAVFIYGVWVYGLNYESGEKVLPRFFSEDAFITELPEGRTVAWCPAVERSNMVWRPALNNQTYNNPTLNHPTLIGEATAPTVIIGDQSDRIATTKFIHDVLETNLADYVLKDGGKVLSDRNYTAEEKTKLAGIAEGADVSPISSDAPSDGKVYGRNNGVWLEVTSGGSGVSDYEDLTNKPIEIYESVESFPATGAANIEYVENGNRYKYIPGDTYPESSAFPDAYPTPGIDWQMGQFGEEPELTNYIYSDLTSLLPLPIGATTIYVKIIENGNTVIKTMTQPEAGAEFATEDYMYMLGNNKTWNNSVPESQPAMGESFILCLTDGGITSVEFISASTNPSGETTVGGYEKKNTLTDTQLGKVNTAIGGVLVNEFTSDNTETLTSISDMDDYTDGNYLVITNIGSAFGFIDTTLGVKIQGISNYVEVIYDSVNGWQHKANTETTVKIYKVEI